MCLQQHRRILISCFILSDFTLQVSSNIESLEGCVSSIGALPSTATKLNFSRLVYCRSFICSPATFFSYFCVSSLLCLAELNFGTAPMHACGADNQLASKGPNDSV